MVNNATDDYDFDALNSANESADIYSTAQRGASATLRVKNVTMNYRSLKQSDLSKNSWQNLKNQTIGLFTNHITVRALRGVSFTAYEGEKIGIMGHNGSGKSTLMRIMAGVEPPSSGSVVAREQPTLLSISAALVPALSGRRNIELGLYALGMKPMQVYQLVPQIAEFAGIGEAIDRPMRTYSSGMGSRLRFAIAASASPHILLLDEALGAGDAAFAQRSELALKQLRSRAGTIIMVSHAAQEIENTCTRALWLHQGRLIADGEARETARKYRWWAWQLAKGETKTADTLIAQAKEEYAEVIRQGEKESLEN